MSRICSLLAGFQVTIIGRFWATAEVVLGILQRGGKVRTKVVDNRKKKALQAEVREHVEAGSAIYTEALKLYEGLGEFQHQLLTMP
jgi:transposase-like protein